MSENTTELLRLLHVNCLPTEYWDERWHWPSNAEPEALISYASEPNPETGHAGWVWWAKGRMGETHTYEAAKAAALVMLRHLRTLEVTP